MTLPRCLALILLAGVAGFAHAGEEAADGKRHQRGEGRCHAHLLKKWDADKDGTLSDAEKQAARAHLRAKALAKWDADKDGTLSDAEKQAARGAHRAKALAKWDADKDGTLSDAEKQARRAHIKERCGKKKARADG
ncbi:MAG: hypothetical protein H0X45_09675 [Planctomycetes bacterium]|nr:hypothetical protein [Planctomycetota bacterium]